MTSKKSFLASLRFDLLKEYDETGLTWVEILTDRGYDPGIISAAYLRKFAYGMDAGREKAIALGWQPPPRKPTISVSRDTHDRVGEMSKVMGVTMGDVVDMTVRAYDKDHWEADWYA